MIFIIQQLRLPIDLLVLEANKLEPKLKLFQIYLINHFH